MLESEDSRVKRLPAKRLRDLAQRGIFWRFSVKNVAQKRRSVIREVHSNLMRAPSFEAALNESHGTETLAHAHMRDGALSADDLGAELLSVGRMPAMHRVEGNRVGEFSDSEPQVHSLDVVSLEQRHKAILRAQ